MKTEFDNGATLGQLLRFLRPLRALMAFSITMRILNQSLGIALITGACAGVMVMAGHALPGGYASVSLGTMAFALAMLGLVKGLCRYLEQFSGHAVAFHLLSLLRHRLYERLELLAPAGLGHLRSGDVISRVISDVDRMEIFYAHTIAPALTALVVPPLTLVALAFLDARLALVTIPFLLAVGVLVPWGTYWLGRRAADQSRAAVAELNAHFVDSLQGVREVIASGYETERLAEIRRRGERLAQHQSGLARAGAWQILLSDLLIGLGLVTALYLGAQAVAAGMLTVLELVMAITLVIGAFVPLLGISNLIPDLAQALSGAQRLFALMNQQPEINEQEGRRDVDLTDAALTFRNVSFAYRTRPDQAVLRDVSFAIAPGETVALVGPSGTGKSTIVQLLLRFWEPGAGVIWLGGHRIDHLAPELLRAHIAVVSQHTHLFHASIRDNLRLAQPDATDAELIAAARLANLHDFIHALPQGYDTMVGEMGATLSGGQRQRMAIARAILKDAPFLVLDEATAHLDADNEQAILQSLRVWLAQPCRHGRRTLLVIAHRASSLAQADRILRLEEGRIVEEFSSPGNSNTTASQEA